MPREKVLSRVDQHTMRRSLTGFFVAEDLGESSTTDYHNSLTCVVGKRNKRPLELEESTGVDPESLVGLSIPIRRVIWNTFVLTRTYSRHFSELSR